MLLWLLESIFLVLDTKMNNMESRYHWPLEHSKLELQHQESEERFWRKDHYKILNEFSFLSIFYNLHNKGKFHYLQKIGFIHHKRVKLLLSSLFVWFMQTTSLIDKYKSLYKQAVKKSKKNIKIWWSKIKHLSDSNKYLVCQLKQSQSVLR